MLVCWFPKVWRRCGIESTQILVRACRGGRFSANWSLSKAEIWETRLTNCKQTNKFVPPSAAPASKLSRESTGGEGKMYVCSGERRLIHGLGKVVWPSLLALFCSFPAWSQQPPASPTAHNV